MNMHTNGELQNALESQVQKLYAVFKMRPPRSIPGCHDCCLNQKVEAELLKGSLESIDPYAFGIYRHNAGGTVGSESDFRYFLPRICQELPYLDSDIELQMEVAGFANFKWHAWTERETNAIRDWFLAWWRVELRSEDRTRLTDVLGAIARTQHDLTPFLQAWDEDLSIEASKHLFELCNKNLSSLPATISPLSWIGSTIKLDDQVARWLVSADHATRIRDAGKQVVDDSLAQEIELVADILQNMAVTRV